MAPLTKVAFDFISCRKNRDSLSKSPANEAVAFGSNNLCAVFYLRLESKNDRNVLVLLSINNGYANELLNVRDAVCR